LKFIAQTHRLIHYQRWQEEVRVFFTCATFYALIGAAKFTGRFQIPTQNRGSFVLVAWIFLSLVAMFSCLYLRALHASNAENRACAERAENVILDALGLERPKTPNIRWGTKRWQMIMIILLAAALACALTFF